MLEPVLSMCRFCLCEEKSCDDNPLVNLFQNYTFDSLRKKTEDCLKIKLSPDDKIPPLICQRCLDKVNYFSDFLESVRNSGKQMSLLYDVEDGDYYCPNTHDEEEQRVSYEGLNSGKFESDDSDMMNHSFNPRKSSEDLSGDRKQWMDAGDSTKPMKRCRICSKALFGLKSIKTHMATHWREQQTNQLRYESQEKIPPFGKCKSTILRKNHLAKRRSKNSVMTPKVSHLPPKKNPNKKIICKICQKVFRQEARLAAHMKQQHPTQKVRFNAHKKRRIRQHKGFKVSAAGLTKTSKGFRCKFCGKQFETLRHLHEHLSSHSNSNSKKRCPKCNKQFAFKKHFDKHVWRCFYGPTNVARKTSSLPLI